MVIISIYTGILATPQVIGVRKQIHVKKSKKSKTRFQAHFGIVKMKRNKEHQFRSPEDALSSSFPIYTRTRHRIRLLHPRTREEALGYAPRRIEGLHRLYRSLHYIVTVLHLYHILQGNYVWSLICHRFFSRLKLRRFRLHI